MIKVTGFPPFINEDSLVLVLGSFPSVKSRAQGFYYGNPQNRFWRACASFFSVPEPKTLDEKKDFLLRRRIALWDIVTSCEIEGSSDASIQNETIADIPALVSRYPLKSILCNGSKAFTLLAQHHSGLLPISKRLCSTSPANPRFSLEEWRLALQEVFS